MSSRVKRVLVCHILGSLKQRFMHVQLLPLHGGGLALALYAVVLVCMGLSITWAATACNNPIFSEIVPPRLRNLVRGMLPDSRSRALP